MKKRSLQILVLSLLCCQLIAQNVEVDTNARTVISLNGLNIRAEPSIKSSKLGGIPFLAKVQYLSASSYGRDTVGSHRFYYEDDYYDQPVIGDWIKIKFNGTIGYVLDAYLAYPNNEKQIPGTNEEFGINHIQGNCFYNFYHNNNLKWFGIYKVKNQYSLRKVSISYFMEYVEAFDYNELAISTKDNKGLLLLIGDSKGIFKEGTLTRKIDKEPIVFNNMGMHPVSYDTTNWELVERSKLYLKQGNQKQLLNPKAFNFSMPYNLEWQGDLDRDGKLDYIINYGDKSAQQVLYLSSQAKSGEIVKAVAVYYYGYCC